MMTGVAGVEEIEDSMLDRMSSPASNTKHSTSLTRVACIA